MTKLHIPAIAEPTAGRKERAAPKQIASKLSASDKAHPIDNPFSKYRVYISHLESLMDEVDLSRSGEVKIAAALNGQATLELRRIADVETRLKFGTFFTGTKLSTKLLSELSRQQGNRFFYDPTCGMGDLLLAAAKSLPRAKTLRGTLALWGRHLAGTDLHSEFIDGAKIRLMLLARFLHQTRGALTERIQDFFPNIRVGDGLNERKEFWRSNTLLMNPPYGVVRSTSGCTWAKGRVSEAATFMATALERAQPGTEILAILPDILRAGTFSKHWRNHIGTLSEVHMVKPYGVFDNTTDVKVFISRFVRRQQTAGKLTKLWPKTRRRGTSTVGAWFNVRVGRVVPYRDNEPGPKYRYIHPKTVRVWETMDEVPEKREFDGHTFNPPFVLIKRTSRSDDIYRATAAVVVGNEPVAVENHLLVCEPKDGGVEICRKLMVQLKTEATNNHLNKRICCRHLTVGSVEEIPFDPA